MLGRILLLPAFLSAIISVGDARGPQKIVNGKPASITEFPFQVSLQTMKGKAFCGGTIIDEVHILTAAHCIVRPNLTYYDDTFIVVTGTADKEKRTPENVFLVIEQNYHPDYTYGDIYKNDIAVLKVHKPIPFNKYRKPAQLPTRDPPAFTKLQATGWGATIFHEMGWHFERIPRYLQKLETMLLTNEQCQAALSVPDSVVDYLLAIRVNVSKLRDHKLDAGQMCAYARSGDVCKGDSGGPLSYNGIVFGIASWNIGCNQGFPSFFTRVSSYLPWIRRMMESSSSNVWST